MLVVRRYMGAADFDLPTHEWADDFRSDKTDDDDAQPFHC